MSSLLNEENIENNNDDVTKAGPLSLTANEWQGKVCKYNFEVLASTQTMWFHPNTIYPGKLIW